MIKISEKFPIYAPHLDELFYKKTLDKIISISKDIKHHYLVFSIYLSRTGMMGKPAVIL